MSGRPTSVGGSGGDSSSGGGSGYVGHGSTSSSSGGYADRYGGGSYSGGGGPPSSFDYTQFLPQYNATDIAFAWVKLILGSVFIVLGVYILVYFYRSRWILDIRTRSARLTVLGGSAVVLSFLTSINLSCEVLWSITIRWFWTSLVLFFVLPLLFGSYVCRALRLAVVFHPRAKRALPWLIPERNYLYALMASGVLILGIPIYHEYTLDGPQEVIPKQTEMLAVASITMAGLLAALYPFIRKVDDIFNISRELMIVTVALLIMSVGGKLVTKFGDEDLNRWIGPNNLNFLVSAFVLGVSVVDPLRRLAFDPLAASKRKHADRVLLSRREARTASRSVSGVSRSGRVSDNEDEGEAPASTSRMEEGSVTAADDAAGGGGGGGTVSGAARVPSVGRVSSTSAHISYLNSIHPHANSYHLRRLSQRVGHEDGIEDVWDFERLASTPLLAAAFEEFSRKALCHESVLFLSEVSRYENRDYAAPSPDGGPAQFDFTTPPASVAITRGPTQFDAFVRITNTFIRAGSPEEVNISDSDKRRIVAWANRGLESFDSAPEAERRLVFGQAYMEVRNMLEANLLLRFLNTDEFRDARTRREHITAMMGSPETASVAF